MSKNNKYYVINGLIVTYYPSLSNAISNAKRLSKGDYSSFEVWVGDKYYMNKYLLAIYQNGLRVYENFKTDEITIIEKVESEPKMIKIDFK